MLSVIGLLSSMAASKITVSISGGGASYPLDSLSSKYKVGK